MGREVRRVPSNWVHPRGPDGRLRPMFDRSYRKEVDDWKAGYERWKTNPESDCEYWEWAGMPPESDRFMPQWPEEERTHIQMYETCSEGTPISPVMDTPERLAQWLADNGASAFGGMSATYDQWLATIKAGFSVGMVVTSGGGMRSGVAFNGERERRD